MKGVGLKVGIMDNEVKDIEALSKVKGFKLVHLNVRSLVKKIDQVRILLGEANLDVITLSETWLSEAVHSNTVELDSYILYRQDRHFKRVGKKRGGGLLTFIHSKYAAECEQLTELSCATKDIEAQWSAIHRPHCKSVWICNLYRPPKGNLETAVDYLDECLKQVDMSKNEVYVLGDFNVNYKNKLSEEYKKLNFMIKANGLSQVVDNTTRNSDKSSSLLDIILTNSKYISVAGTLGHFISDHQPVYVVKKKARDSRPKVEFEGRSYRNYNKERLREALQDMDWADLHTILDPDDAWDFIVSRFLPIIDQMCPVRKFQIKNYRPDWITPELIEQIKDRDYFYNKAKLTKEEDDWNIAKHLRNVTNANIRQAKRDYILDELQENKSDYKKFWKTIRSVIPSGKETNQRDILLMHDRRKLQREKVAQYVNEYFINIGNMGKDPKQVQEVETQTGLDGSSVEEDPWSFAELTETEVLRVIKNINISKSSGLNNISSFVVKEVFSILKKQITLLFNTTIRTSTFQLAWKQALVIPIPKSGILTKVQNYRPISLLPLPGKLLEKLIHSQLSEHLEEISYLTENQHGFRKSHSTVHSVAQLVNYVSSKRDQRRPTLAAFVDFRKAFDCVQHPILLDKLKAINLDEGVVRWFESYLSERKQRVLANNTFSPYLPVTQGVPQGSVLGPLFYIIYANDVARVIKNCSVAMYADDTVLYTANTDFTVSLAKMQEDVKSLSIWCEINGISMNVDKTCTMLFGAPKRIRDLPPFEIRVGDTAVKQVQNYKYLGVTLDSQLNYNKHIQKTISNVSLKLKQFRRMRSFLNTTAATLVYKNMILPLIEYGDLFLVGASVVNRRRLQVLQNRGLRCALNRDKDESVSELHKEADLWELKYRRDLHMLNYMFDRAQLDTNLKKRGSQGCRLDPRTKKSCG